MKRERRLYSHGAGSYRGLPEREAYLTFVEAIEGIIAEEQNIFWRDLEITCRPILAMPMPMRDI